MPKKKPYLPLYVRDWMSDSFVRSLNFFERGVYLEMLMWDWLEGGIPSDFVRLLDGLRTAERWSKRGRIADAARTLHGRFSVVSPCGTKKRHPRLVSSSSYTNTDTYPPSPPSGGGTPKKALRFDASPHRERWNTLAAEQGLPAIRGTLSEPRRRKLQARLKELPEFWELVIPAIRQRGQWARENRFPTFDQVLEPRLLTKLLEGNYAPKGASEAADRQDEETARRAREILRECGVEDA